MHDILSNFVIIAKTLGGILFMASGPAFFLIRIVQDDTPTTLRLVCYSFAAILWLIVTMSIFAHFVNLHAPLH